MCTRSHPILAFDICTAFDLERRRELASVARLWTCVPLIVVCDGRHITDYFNYLLVSAVVRDTTITTTVYGKHII